MTIDKDKMLGALYGALVGDALGVTYEFMTPESVLEATNNQPLEIVGGGPFAFDKGQGSDDTDLLKCAMRSYSPHGHKFLKDEMVFQMTKWLKTNPPDVGTTTQAAILKHATGLTPPVDEQAQGNGGIMRAMGHSLMSVNVIMAGNNAYDDTRLTHNSHTAGMYSAMYATVLRRIIDGRNTDGALHNIQDKGYAELTPSMRGHCTHTYRLALWAWRYAQDFESGMEDVILSGGDTDTNAIVAGAMLGAQFGYSNIPERWINALADHPQTLLREVLTERWKLM